MLREVRRLGARQVLGEPDERRLRMAGLEVGAESRDAFARADRQDGERHGEEGGAVLLGHRRQLGAEGHSGSAIPSTATAYWRPPTRSRG